MRDQLWIGGIVTAPLYLTEGEPYRPDLVVWIDTGSGRVLNSEVAEPADSAGVLAASYSNAVRELRSGQPPRRVRVANPELAAAIRTVVGDDTRIEIVPTPEVSEVVDSLARFLATKGQDPEDHEGPSYFEGGRVPPETVAAFFEASAGLYRVAPWKRLWDAEIIGLDVPALGLERAVISVMGRGGQSFGFMLLDSAVEFDAMHFAAGNPLQGEDLGTAIMSLNYEPKTKLPPAMRREIVQHGWMIAAPKGHPYILAVDRDRVVRPLVERDVRLMTAVADSLARFFTTHGDALSAVMTGTIVEEYTVSIASGLKVRITAPHPEIPWRPDAPEFPEALDATQESGDLDLDDEGALKSEIVRTTDAFVESQRVAGRSEPELDSAGHIAWSMLDFLTQYAGATPGQMTEFHVDEFLLGHFPRKVSATEELIESAPDLVIAFYEWQAARGEIAPAVATAARKRVSMIRNRFLAAARDPSRHGPAKSFVTAMEADGVDFTDEAAVREYMLRYNERQTPARSSGRTATSSAPIARRRPGRPSLKLSPRWIPAPGEEPPPLNAPCPCASGKTYRKCCRPR